MEITANVETQIEVATAVITNPGDRQDAMQHIRLKLLSQPKTIKTNIIMSRFIAGRLKRWMILHKAQGLTFGGRPTIYEAENYNHLPRPEYVKMPKQLADNSARRNNQKKLRKLVIWIINQWIKQC